MSKFVIRDNAATENSSRFYGGESTRVSKKYAIVYPGLYSALQMIEELKLQGNLNLTTEVK